LILMFNLNCYAKKQMSDADYFASLFANSPFSFRLIPNPPFHLPKIIYNNPVYISKNHIGKTNDRD
ncbi:hypothetical protein, partial [Avibacterium volantium]|uniref:hypothetical protein n=1 Tax=Avibacterium TaxID=292486 RepID=UPI003BF7ECAB